jgi:hypothetical protein
MTSYTDSPRGVLRSVGGQDYRFTPTYLRKRDPITPSTSPDVKPKEQQGYYPISSLWTNVTNQNVWLLAGIVNNLGKWILITSGAVGPLISFTGGTGTTGFPVFTNSLGQIQLSSNAGTLAITGTPSAINLDVVGGAAIDTIITDTGGTGLHGGTIHLDSAVPYAAGTGPNSIAVTNSTATQGNIAIQLAGSNAATSTANDFGISQFDSNMFTVSAGFVQFLHLPISKIVRQSFALSGTYTPTTGMLYCDIEAVGGGGGGGGCAATTSAQLSSAGGGGGGGYSKGLFSSSTIGVSQVVTVGAAGAAGTAGNNAGGTGGTTSVGALITGGGGTGGGGGAAVTTASVGGALGMPGIGTLGNVHCSGDAGIPGLNLLIAAGSGFPQGGMGGSAFYGAGGALSSSSAGNGGLFFGSGGGGASSGFSAAAAAGGAGGPGFVLITEYVYG